MLRRSLAHFAGGDAIRGFTRRDCILKIYEPVRWAIVNTIMRSTARRHSVQPSPALVAFFSEFTRPQRPHRLEDNIWQIDLYKNGQLIPDRNGPHGSVRVSTEGCCDSRLVFVQVDDSSSKNLSVETLQGLLCLGTADDGSEPGVVAMRTNREVIPQCFRAVSLCSNKTARYG